MVDGNRLRFCLRNLSNSNRGLPNTTAQRLVRQNSATLHRAKRLPSNEIAAWREWRGNQEGERLVPTNSKPLGLVASQLMDFTAVANLRPRRSLQDQRTVVINAFTNTGRFLPPDQAPHRSPL